MHTVPENYEASGQLLGLFDSDEALVHVVGSYLLCALRASGITLVAGAGETRAQLANHLAIEDDATGTPVHIDVEDALRSCVVDGVLDLEAFDALVMPVVRGAAQRGGPVHCFGEIMGLLWTRGDVLVALELEDAWTQLCEAHDFELLCNYANLARADEQTGHVFHDACARHSGVGRLGGGTPHGIEVAGPPARDDEVERLQAATDQLEDSLERVIAANEGLRDRLAETKRQARYLRQRNRALRDERKGLRNKLAARRTQES